LKEISILFVEDDLINQKITLLTLKPLVYSMETASNGKEAIERLSSSDFDLILMDIQMPVMNGIAAAENKRSGTGYSCINSKCRDRAWKNAYCRDDYISKPYLPASLIEKIKRII
jgi:CheY-like chemotaxis protein